MLPGIEDEIERLPHGSKDSDHKGNCLLPSLLIKCHLETNLMISAVRQVKSTGRDYGVSLSKAFKVLVIYAMCVECFACRYVCASCVCMVPMEVRSGHWLPWSYGWL